MPNETFCKCGKCGRKIPCSPEAEWVKCGECGYRTVIRDNPEPVNLVDDPVNHPSHYLSHPSGIECIEITRHMSFNIGNVIKYCWRAGEKNSEIEDLKKAAWYLADEIMRLEK